ncbi:MAG TPA: hypothetical protein VEL06_01245 [Haliangiales bacterium]|nr:hypothetical protein [Haliangiales bacterium]
MFAVIALIAFWGAAIRLWMLDEPKIALVFVALWVVGFFGFPMLHWPGTFFLAYECILAVILLIIERYKSLT